MSFSGQVKSELCRTVPAQRCCALAQCFGILLYCNTFTGDGVRIVTESRELGGAASQAVPQGLRLLL